MEIKQNLISTDKYSLKCPYSMTPKGICIHNTANDASAKNEIAYMKSNNNPTSYHIAIDDIEAIQGLPFNRNGWHSGDGSNGNGNRNYIGIEICYSLSGGDKFVKAEKNCAKIVAKLLKQYGWGIDKVKKHQDFSNKYCPHRTLELGWQRFIKIIQAEMLSLEKPISTKPTNNQLYRVRKSWNDVSSQIGAYADLSNAKKECKSGYSVFDNKGNKVYPIVVAAKPISTKKYLNLKPHVASWRVYKPNVAAKVGNECGFLAPKTFGGLSYEIIKDSGDLKTIKTQSFGEVRIYAPRDNDSTITNSPTYK